MANGKLSIAALIMALGMPALAQTNEELLQERLITRPSMNSSIAVGPIPLKQEPA